MDTSETYIKVCETAEEIQVTRKGNLNKGWEKDDLFSLWGGVFRRSELQFWETWQLKSFEEHAFWLPRQDQSQEILLDGRNMLTPLIGALYKWLIDSNYDQYFNDVTSNPYFSMEQLWFAFAMKEKHNKTWDGEAWNLTIRK